MTKGDRTKLKQKFLRHRGEITGIARKLGITSHGVSQWFKGTTESARIQAAVIERAKQLGFIADDSQAA